MAAILLVGLAARSHDLSYSFDFDEVFSVKLAANNFAEVVIGSLEDRPHPPLHNVLLHAWLNIFGVSEIAARSLSLLFSALFLVFSYALMRRFVDTWLALSLLAVLALSPLFVYYGQQARPYALIALLASANMLAFLRVVDRADSPLSLAMWAASCTLLMYAQYLGILLIGVEIAYAIFVLRWLSVRIVTYGLVGATLVAPWLIAAMGTHIAGGADPLEQIAWMERPTASEFGWFFVSIFGEAPWLKPRWLLIALLALLIGYVRHAIVSKRWVRHELLMFAIAFGLPTIAFAISVLGPKPILASRQLLGAATALVIALGLCIQLLPRRFATLVVIGILAWIVSAFPDSFASNATPPWREINAQIEARYGAAPVFGQSRWVRDPLSYYRKSANVLRWHERPESEPHDVVFVCHVARGGCATIEKEPFKAQSVLVATYTWGRNASPYRQVRVYKVRGASQ